MTNLIMYDRRGPSEGGLVSAEESLWPQMMAEARCGPLNGSKLAQYPFVEMEWASWLELHPETQVPADADEQGFIPLYESFFGYSAFSYPYGAYEGVSGWFNGVMPPIDGRRFSNERVIGVPSGPGEPGIAFPFGALEDRDGSFQALRFTFGGTAHVLLWSDEAQGGMVFRPFTKGGAPVALVATPSGFLDEETGSTWTLEGWAITGPMEGERLEPLVQAYTAFWGAWAAFHPQTRLWEG